MKKLIIGLLISALVAAESAAAADRADTAYTAQRPGAAPVQATTGFDPALKCMDDLLSRNGYAKGLDLYANDLADPKGDVGAATRDMIVTAASRMSEKSRFFRIHPALGAELPPYPLFVKGSITAYDKAVAGKGSGGGLGLDVSGLGLRKQSQSSVLTVTLYLIEQNGQLVPGTVQSVSMALNTSSKGGDLTGEIGPVGGFFELEFSHSDGVHQAVRALVELAMIEAVGSYAQVPYQRCLAIGSTDPMAVQQARKVFDKMKPGDQLQAIGKALIERDLLAAPAPTTLTEPLRSAIASYQAQQGMPPLGLPGFDVYYSLYQTAYGAPSAVTAPMTPGPAVKVAPYGPSFIVHDDDYVIITGNRASFAITLARPGFLACYYTDGEGRTTKIFPNLQRPGGHVLAGDTVILPGPQDVYAIEPQTTRTKEAITCLAAPEAFMDRLPAALKGEMQPGAAPIPVANVNDLVLIAQRAQIPALSWDRFEYLVFDPSDLISLNSPPKPQPAPQPRPAG